MSLKAYLSTHRKPASQSLTSVVFGERLRKFRDLLNLTHNTSNRRKLDLYLSVRIRLMPRICYISFDFEYVSHEWKKMIYI